MTPPPAGRPGAPPPRAPTPIPKGRVSVLVVSWNSMGFLPECLGSIGRQTHPDVETIVVDNGSTDGSADYVAGAFPRATLIRNASNEGFCRANNAALKAATGVFILCLNADAILEPDFIDRALTGFTSAHRVGMVTGKILRFDGVTIDSTGQILTSARRIVDRGYGERDDGRYDAPGEVFSVCGAAALYWRGMIDVIAPDGALFDETFFAFGEDMDVSWRAQRAGFRGWYEPRARVRHYRGGTQEASGRGLLGRTFRIARRPPAIRAHIVKNRWLTILKNDNRRDFLRHLPSIAAWEIAQAGWLVLLAPRTIPFLWRERETLRAAWRRRKLAPVPAGSA